MVRATLVVGLLLTMVGSLPAGDQPKGLPPRVMKAEVDKDGQASLRVIVTSYRSVVREVTEVVNGRKVKRLESVTVPVTQAFKVGLSDPGVEVYDTAGKRVDMKRMRLAGPTPVLVSADANPVDPFYVRLAREGTLIVVVPRNLLNGPPIAPLPLPKVEKSKDGEKP